MLMDFLLILVHQLLLEELLWQVYRSDGKIKILNGATLLAVSQVLVLKPEDVPESAPVEMSKTKMQ